MEFHDPSRQEQERATAYFLETTNQLQAAFSKQDAVLRANHLRDIATFFPQYRTEIENLQSVLSSVSQARAADKGQEELYQNVAAGFKDKYHVQDDTARGLLTDMLFLRIMKLTDKITDEALGVKEVFQSLLTDAKLDATRLPNLTSGEIFAKVLLTDVVKESLPEKRGEQHESRQGGLKAA